MGSYLVYAQGWHYAATSGTGTVCSYAITDGTTTKIVGSNYEAASGSQDSTNTLLGIFNYTSVADREFTVQAKRTTGNGTCEVAFITNDYEIGVIPLTQSLPAPIMISQPSGRFEWNGSTTFALSGSFSIVPFNIKAKENGVSLTTGASAKITIDTAGDYAYSFNVSGGNTNSETKLQAQIHKNNAATSYDGITVLQPASTNLIRINLSTSGILVGLSVGDYLDIRVKELITVVGGTWDGGGHFEIWKI